MQTVPIERSTIEYVRNATINAWKLIGAAESPYLGVLIFGNIMFFLIAVDAHCSMGAAEQHPAADQKEQEGELHLDIVFGILSSCYGKQIPMFAGERKKHKPVGLL